MNSTIKKRDGRLDALKGIAISLVVLGHILQAGYVGYENTVLFRVIWSLQMPLFMVVSGYLAGGAALRRIARRAQTYLIPFASCFLIKMLVFAHRLDVVRWVKELPFHLENSLWYLFVLFVLSTFHILARHFTDSVRKKYAKANDYLLYTLFFGLFLLVEVVLAVLVSPSFLGAKLVLYYAVFFWLGQMWQLVGRTLAGASDRARARVQALLNGAAIPIGLVYLWFVTHTDIYALGDGVTDVLLRLLISALGVFLVIKTVYAVYSDSSRLFGFCSRIGRFTLEIYYLHYLCIFHALRFLVPAGEKITAPVFSVEGLIALVVYYFVLLGLSYLLSALIDSSPYLAFLVFGKSLPASARAAAHPLPDSPTSESEKPVS